MSTTTCPMRHELRAAGEIRPVHGRAVVSFSPPSESLLFPLLIAPRHETDRASRQARARARTLLSTEIDFVTGADFVELEDAQTAEANSPQAADSRPFSAGSDASVPHNGEPRADGFLNETGRISSQEEVALFRRMNYLKYRAHALRAMLDPESPCAALMCEIERLLAESSSIRNRLVSAFIRLVGSIARRFIDPQHPYEELVSEGCAPLLRAIAKFDFRRGYRFSTYATHAVQRHFFRLYSKARKEQARYVQAAVERFENGVDKRRRRSRSETQMLAAVATIQQMIERLDSRERYIVRSRYGLVRGEHPQTLNAIGQTLGVCKERVRQLERRAIRKLRDMADEAELEAPMF